MKFTFPTIPTYAQPMSASVCFFSPRSDRRFAPGLFVNKKPCSLQQKRRHNLYSRSFLWTFGMDSIESFKIIGTLPKNSFSCTLLWFFGNIFETSGNFEIMFLSREKSSKKKQKKIILFFYKNIIFQRNNRHLCLKKSKIS